jgi:superfamily I DNA/RNA helicase
LYLAYNKAIATAAKKKFPKTTNCSTTHSLAYQAVVKSYNLLLGDFSYRSIKESITYEHKIEIVNLIKEFCLSKYLDFATFAEKSSDFIDITKYTITLCESYLEQMYSGKIECTHDFYLKVFHLALNDNLIDYSQFDFVMLDEIGDVNEVTLEIFKLLPSKLKIGTGDKAQNIYQFNHTINAFDVLKDTATFFHMTKSFRVSSVIALDIEKFVQSYIDPNMKFEGIAISDSPIVSRAFISRTNSTLVAKMIELQRLNTPYSLVRKVDDIYRHALMVASFKYQGNILDKAYKHVQEDIDIFFENVLPKDKSAKLLVYLLSKHTHDFILQQAIKLVLTHGIKTIFSSYDFAKLHESNKLSNSLILATAHSVKGNEYDEVTIGNDINELVKEIINNINQSENTHSISEYERSELNLAYVAASRAKKKLNNATFLCL